MASSSYNVKMHKQDNISEMEWQTVAKKKKNVLKKKKTNKKCVKKKKLLIGSTK